MRICILFFCTFYLLLSAFLLPCAAGEWEIAIAPYALLPSIKGDSSVNRVEGADVDVKTEDIIKNLDIGGMVHIEAQHKSGYGAILTYAYMSLSDDVSGPAGFTKVEADIFQGILEAFATCRLETKRGPVDIYGGVRWWDIDIDLDTSGVNGPRSFDGGDTWIDPVIGARWSPAISKNWRAIIKGDIGGFGAGSDFSWNLQGGFYREISESIAFAIQYRALSVDYSTGTPGTSGRFAYDTITHGPMLGFVFRL